MNHRPRARPTQVLVRLLFALVLIALVLIAGTGCSTSDERPSRPDVRGSGAPEKHAKPKLQRLPRDWSRVAFDGVLARRVPSPDGLPSILDEPSRALLVVHPVERWGDGEGWANEVLVVLGTDGRWRRLDMADLGLEESWWPGEDTYGAGELSADGRRWAAHTNAGVVFVNLAKGTVRHVAFPRKRAFVRSLEWIPGKDVVSAYARSEHGRRYRTYEVSVDGTVERAAYSMLRTTFDTDGTPVPGGGLFSESAVAEYEMPRGDRGTERLRVFDKSTRDLLARLKLPRSTSMEGWRDDGSLVLLVDSRHLITWHPGSGEVRRLTELRGPYPRKNEWAAATVSLAPTGPA